MVLPGYRATWLAVLALVCAANVVNAQTIKACISVGDEGTCESALEEAYGQTSLEFTCTKLSSDEECLKAVRAGDADVTIVGGNQLFAAHSVYNLAAIVAESASEELGTASYYGVALTKRENCETVDDNPTEGGGSIKGLDSSLKGSKACHTGYRKTSGWMLPVGTLINEGAMDPDEYAAEAKSESVRVDAETVEKFWGDDVCAPGTTEFGPKYDANGNGQIYNGEDGNGGLCKLCKDDCTGNDPYAGYTGALYCMDEAAEGGAYVAFVKESTPLTYETDRDAEKTDSLKSNTSQLVGICSSGCRTLYESDGKGGYRYKMDDDVPVYESCNTGKSAANAMVARRDFVDTSAYKTLLARMGLEDETEANVDTDIVKEGQAGLWSSDTIKLHKLAALGDPKTDEGFKSFFTAYDQFKNVLSTESKAQDPLKVCIAGEDLEAGTCTTRLQTTYAMAGPFECVTRGSDDLCLQAVKAGDADLAVVGGFQLFAAREDYKLAAIVAESTSLDLGSASYYGVALTKKSMCSSDAIDGGQGSITGLDMSLKGRKACHTGYRKTSGWVLPVGKLIDDGIMDPMRWRAEAQEENVRVDAETVEKFWEDNVCAPGKTADGPKIDEDGNGQIYGEVGGGGLCKLCKTDCTENDPYAGYEGAVLCMDEDDEDETTGGDIAFVKHSTIKDYTAGLTEDKSEYVGICPTKSDGSAGGCMQLYDSEGNYFDGPDGQPAYLSCSTGKSASNALVSKEEFVGTARYNQLMAALGLSYKPDASAPIDNGGITTTQANDVKAEETVGLWSEDTSFLYRLGNPTSDEDFKDSFFTAFNQFEEIRNTDKLIVCISEETSSETACENALDGAYADLAPFTCIKRDNDDGCLQAIKNNQADLTVVGGNQLFAAHERYDLAAIVAESSSTELGDASYYGVALTKKNKCRTVDDDDTVGGPITGLDSNLKGMKACHTGYRKTSGWYLPVGKLSNKEGGIDFDRWAAEAREEGVRVDAEAVEKFWEDNVCAPGTTAGGPKLGGGLYGEPGGGGLCKLCKDDCSEGGPYAGYDGALYCMDDVDGGGDIAFVKHSTVRDYSPPEARAELSEDKSNYVGICDSGCMTLFDDQGNPLEEQGRFKYEDCNTGKSASNAMVARKGFVGSHYYDKLLNAMGLSNSGSADVDADIIKENDVGVWSDDTAQLIKLSNPATTEGFKDFFTAYDGFKEIYYSEALTVCITDGTTSACEDAMNSAYGSIAPFTCIKKISDDECLQAVKSKEADLTVVGGNQLFVAFEHYQLAPFAAESSSTDLGDASYYGVALTKKGMCQTVDGTEQGGPITGLDESLRGKKACHTGYRKTSGWYLPVGKLSAKGVMDFDRWAGEAREEGVRVDAETVEKFWDDNVCAPGTTAEGPMLGGEIYGEPGGGGLCKLCKVDCTANDPYAGYDGALYCMDDEDGGGDIAFVKHSTVRDYAPPETGAELSLADKSNYVGICDSGCMTLFNEDGSPMTKEGGGYKYEDCSTGKSASNAMVTRREFVGTAYFQELLQAMGLGRSDPVDVDATSDIIKEDDVGVWSDDTAQLIKVPDPTTEQGFKNFFTAYDGFKEIFDSDRQEVRVCISSGTTEQCKQALNQAYGRQLDFECMAEGNDEDCLKAIKEGRADLSVVGGSELFLAHNQYDLAAYVAENAASSIGTASYYGVAVVHKDKCDNWRFDRDTLQGKNICSTGYRKTAGWVLPVGKMLDKNIIEVDGNSGSAGVNQDAYLVGEFFGSVCAADRGTPPTDDGSTYEPLCNGCSEEEACTSDNQYADYTGALQCLIDDEADVAFVKQSTFSAYVNELQNGNPDGRNDVDAAAKSNYQLLCDSGCMDWTDENAQLDECATGKSASNALVGRKSFVDSDVYPVLMSALGFKSLNELEVDLEKSTYPSAAAALKEEDKVGFWSRDTATLTKLVSPETDAGFKDFFSAYNNFKEIRDSDIPSGSDTQVRVCVPFDDKTLVSKCSEVMNAQYGGTSDDTDVSFKCYNGGSSEGCMKRIADGTDHLTIFGGDELFLSHELYGLEAYVAESTDGTSTASYYGVAVVKANKCTNGTFTGFNKQSLQGKKACHTGYRKTAGWVLPVGKMLRDDIMPLMQDPTGQVNADAYSTAQFFSQVCAARTVSGGPSKDGSTYAPLCELCGEASGATSPCAGNQETNPYYDYTGAFRCMDDESGDVAFVKHTTLDDFNQENGSDKPAGDYKLLCDSGCRDYKQENWLKDECKTGESASNAVVAKAGFTNGNSLAAAAIKSLLNGGNDNAPKVAAKAINGNQNFFWGMSTDKVLNVEGQTFNNEFFQAYENFREIRNSDMTTVRVCISKGSEDSCQNALMRAYGSSSLRFECVKVSDDADEECLQKVKNQEADVTIVGGNELFAANDQYSLAAIVAESTGSELGDASYYGVALTKRDKCLTVDGADAGGSITGLNSDLKGMKACHTGYRKTSGWYLPVGKLSNKEGGIDFEQWAAEAREEGVRVDAEAVEKFWDDNVCAPGTTANGPKIGPNGQGQIYNGGDSDGGLCKLCKGDCSGETESEPYAGYAGALYCMDEENAGGDIAFVKHSTPVDYPSIKSDNQDPLTSANDLSQYVGICDTGCKKLYNSDGSFVMENSQPVYETCSTGKSASNAMVARKEFVDTTAYTTLLAAMGLSSAQSAAINAGGEITSSEVNNLIDESQTGLWSADTERLYRLANPKTGFKDFFTAYDSFKEIRDSDLTDGEEVKVCVPSTSDELVEACSSVMNAQYGGTFDGKAISFKCYKGSSDENCMQRISDGTDHITTFGGDELFLSHAQYGLEALVAESYDDRSTATYFGLAVVKADKCSDGSFNGFNRASLQGKKACHTGYRKTAGWVLPVGKMLQGDNPIMPTVSDPDEQVNTDAYSASQFFSRMCAPRTTSDGPTKGGSSYAPLCDLCQEASDVTNSCAGDQEENPYYDYTGAFRCMDEGAGDVAFVKHTTIDDYNAQFGTEKVKADYRILCDDKCTDWDEYSTDSTCITGESASKAVVSTQAFKESDLGKAARASLGNFKAAAKEINSEEEFFWSISTSSIIDVADQEFRGDFFQAYSNFQAIRAAEALDAGEIRVCISSGSADSCSTALNNAYGGAVNQVRFTCSLANSDAQCLSNVEDGQQDVTVVGGNELFLANAEHGLVAYVAEVVDPQIDTASYYGVAVVRTQVCSAGAAFNKETLQGLVACSTGYRKTSGWVLPVGKMLDDDDIMPQRADPDGEVNGDAFSFAKFFRKGVCAPRVVADGPITGGGKYDDLCVACAGDCSAEDPYAGYGGALKCMRDNGNSRLAFVKHTTADDEGLTQEEKGELRLLCADGCREWTAENAMSTACSTGKSASNALVGRKDFDTTKKSNLLQAMGLGGTETANVGARMSNAEKSALVNEAQTGFWSAETKQLKRLTATDAGFKDFFSAYNQFGAIRASEEFKDPEASSDIEVRLSGLPEDVLAAKDSDSLSERQRYNEWVGGFEDEMEKQLEEECGCEVTVTVLEVTPVNRRRFLLATSADIRSRASGSSTDNSKKVIEEINLSKKFSIGEEEYTASNAKTSQADNTAETPSSPRVVEKTEGMHDGGVAGIAVGLFFAGVFVTLIVWFIVYKSKSGRGLPDCVQQSQGSFQRMEEMKYNEYNNPTSSTAAPLNGNGNYSERQ